MHNTLLNTLLNEGDSRMNVSDPSFHNKFYFIFLYFQKQYLIEKHFNYFDVAGIYRCVLKYIFGF